MSESHTGGQPLEPETKRKPRNIIVQENTGSTRNEGSGLHEQDWRDVQSFETVNEAKAYIDEHCRGMRMNIRKNLYDATRY